MLQTILILWVIGAIYWTGFYSNYIWGVWFDEYPSKTYFFKVVDALLVTLVIFIVWFPFAFFIPLPKKFDAFDTELFLDEFGDVNLPKQTHGGDQIESSENRI